MKKQLMYRTINKTIGLLICTTIMLGSSSVFAQTEKMGKLAQTPPMGWNSWNWFGKKDINEKIVKEVIDAMVSEGLRDVGYGYVVIDGGWRDTKLGENGELVPHPEKFPHGIKVLADYAHARGLKLGLHTVPGTHDCAGDLVGGYGHEDVHVKQFADWGIDFIKLDRCRHDGGWNEELLKQVYFKWSKLIRQSGRDMILNISAYRFREWNPEVSQMSRTTMDIAAKVEDGARFDYVKKRRNFLSVMEIAEANNEVAKYAHPGYWNDPDMMVTGDQGLSGEEQKAHFALWCIMSSPLFLGNDPRNMPVYEKDIILNKLAIRVNQEATEQGTLIQDNGDTEIWAKHLSDGNVAVLLLNRDRNQRKTIALHLEDIGFTSKVKAIDVFADKTLGNFSGTLSRQVESQSGLFLVLGNQDALNNFRKSAMKANSGE